MLFGYCAFGMARRIVGTDRASVSHVAGRSVLPQQIRRPDTQCARQSVDDFDARRVPAAFQGADIGSVDRGQIGKLFLRDASRAAVLLQIGREDVSYLHISKGSALQSIRPRSILYNRDDRYEREIVMTPSFCRGKIENGRCLIRRFGDRLVFASGIRRLPPANGPVLDLRQILLRRHGQDISGR